MSDCTKGGCRPLRLEDLEKVWIGGDPSLCAAVRSLPFGAQCPVAALGEAGVQAAWGPHNRAPGEGRPFAGRELVVMWPCRLGRSARCLGQRGQKLAHSERTQEIAGK